MQARRRSGLAARLQQRVLDSPAKVLRIRVCRLDAHREAKHLLAILVSVEDAGLLRVVHQLVVDQGIQHGGVLLGNVPNTSQTNRVARHEEGEAALFRELVDERIGGVTRSADYLERDVIQLHTIAVLQHLFNFVVGLRMKQSRQSHVLVLSSVHGHFRVRLQQLAQTQNVLPRR